MSSQPKLKALIIGINKYYVPEHNLRGCEEDNRNMVNYVKDWAGSQNLELDLVSLRNDQATRQNIIDNFQELFKDPHPQDICLFYFSGHGSQRKAPMEFWDKHHRPDLKLESLVCYDSRSANGRDLVDKELAWLVWSVTQNKMDHPFIMIIDSCHSGGVDRDPIKLEDEGFRYLRSMPTAPAFNNLLGYDDYPDGEEPGTKLAPKGCYVMFSACDKKELAREKIFNLRMQGAFTHFLLDTLKNHNGQLSYAELHQLVRERVVNRVDQQTPQIAAANDDSLNQTFPILSKSKTNS